MIILRSDWGDYHAHILEWNNKGVFTGHDHLRSVSSGCPIKYDNIAGKTESVIPEQIQIA